MSLLALCGLSPSRRATKKFWRERSRQPQHDSKRFSMRELRLSPTNSPLESLIWSLQKEELNIDPPYQRGAVWGSDRCVALIESLTIGLPIGSIFISERPYPEWPVVIDGKQRLLAVRGWIEDKLWVPRRLFEEQELALRGEIVSFSGLSDVGQRRWRNGSHVQVYWSRFQGTLEEIEAQERRLFDLINFGGVPQGESDEV